MLLEEGNTADVRERADEAAAVFVLTTSPREAGQVLSFRKSLPGRHRELAHEAAASLTRTRGSVEQCS